MTTAAELHFLRHVPGNSPVHRMWAGTKLLAVGGVGPVLVFADPALRLVLHGAGAALELAVGGVHLAAVGDVADAVGAARGENCQ